MGCNKPNQIYFSKNLRPNGKRIIHWQGSADSGDVASLPCGRCWGCRLKRSLHWAVRCCHEASLHECNSFITLTYAPEFLPENNSLVKKDYQDFMKRLRERLSPLTVRNYMCGEYGDLRARPHYHSIIFGYDFPDKYPFGISKSGEIMYRSKLLEDVWPFGFSSIGSFSFNSAAYVARYIMKKHIGKDAPLQYCDVDFDTGEMRNIVLPEYQEPSRNPGLGFEWFMRFGKAAVERGFVVVSNKRASIPRYYDTLYERYFPESYPDVKARRIALLEQSQKDLPIDSFKFADEFAYRDYMFFNSSR